MLISSLKHIHLLIFAILFFNLTPSNLSYSLESTCNSVGFANFESTGVPNNGSPFSALEPVTFSGGGEFRDWEGSQDKTANSGTSGSNDFSSGCRYTTANAACPDSQCNPDCFELNPANPGYCGAPTNSPPLNTCGTATTAFRGILDPMGNTNFTTCAGDTDDYLTFRVRLDGDPKVNNDLHFVPNVWQMVLDVPVIDGMGTLIRPHDGFDDFLVAVDGNNLGPSSKVDRVFVFFNNNGAACTMGTQCNTIGARSQSCLDLGTDCFLRDTFTACGERIPNTPGTPGCTMDDATPNCNKSFTRTKVVANPGTGGTQTQEFYIDVMIPITAFTDQNGVRQIYCNTNINMSISSSTTSQDTFNKDAQPDCTAGEICNFGDTTPITLSYFSTKSSGNQVTFNWTTGTETANAGFNIYYISDDGMNKVNEHIIPTKVYDSLTPVNYSYKADVNADTFYIADVTINSEEKLHGPYNLEEEYGTKIKIKKIDWDKISEEHNLAKTERLNSNKLKAINKLKLLKKSGNSLPNISVTSFADLPKINILVNESGIQRVSFQQISDAGLDLAGVPATDIAITNKGVPVPRYIDSSGNGGGAIEFYGQKIDDSLYTETNIYTLEINSELALNLVLDNSTVKNTKKVLDSYTETYIEDNNLSYSESARNGDPWYDTLLVAYPSSPSSKNYTFNLNNLVGNKGIVHVEINGPGDIRSLNPDHHVIVKLNGVKIVDELFEGFASKIITVDLNNTSAQLFNGTNHLDITVPGDLNAPFDLAYIDKYSIEYLRKPVAINDLISLSAKANALTISGFSNQNIVAYRIDNGVVAKMTSLDIKPGGNGVFNVTLNGTANKEYTYIVSTMATLMDPDVELANEPADINSGSAQYLIISHPDFIGGLNDLVTERQAQYDVKIVDVEDIYTLYNYGIFDPEPIKEYIKYAIENMGTEYVLLVGADTYDYKKYLNPDSMSFIPTIYAASEADVWYAPSDPLLADIDGDGVQDAAIGRFPVSMPEELLLIIDKTLQFPYTEDGKKAVFSADIADGATSFSGSSDNLISKIPNDWSVDTAYIDDLGVAGAKAILNNSINEGRAFTSYVGHSERIYWSFEPLYTIDDVLALENEGVPTVVSQYGCWNTYFVHPEAISMAHAFLLNGNYGAAAVMGPSTRTTVQSDSALGEVMIRNIFEGNMPIGMAIKEAKQELKGDFLKLKDVMIGWVLLGDPALEIAD